ncbi:DUF177 domain-containing protein [Tardiphaga sp. P9-11]|jgi:uncharacterized metal-binding protein YceD (DUF177 family)|uniref:YceD family protein n=1 Tax=Tardiphaga sp. P9-11 TaxID=2024614 RepID=UPI0011F27144|nr:DUF177 domain-containing protein [Tardiphaga sp. P9-11]KAA0076140.1 DUF177 domain-containing protein [Tardiphaga sp. P9-11]
MNRPDRTVDLTPPWSVPIAVIQIPETGLARDIEATPAQREGIAALGGLVSVGAAKGELLLTPVKGGTVHVTGRIWGKVEQTCVVTLDPVAADFEEEIDVIFAPPSQIRELAESVDEDIESDEETPDPPEPIENGFIDLGKLATDALFLGLDPYPRKPDAVFEPVVEVPDPEEHPFAALKALKAEPEKPKSKKPGKG